MASEAWFVIIDLTKVRKTRQCRPGKRFNDRKQEIWLSRAEHWRFQMISTYVVVNIRKALLLNIWRPLSTEVIYRRLTAAATSI